MVCLALTDLLIDVVFVVLLALVAYIVQMARASLRSTVIVAYVLAVIALVWGFCSRSIHWEDLVGSIHPEALFLPVERILWALVAQ